MAVQGSARFNFTRDQLHFRGSRPIVLVTASTAIAVAAFCALVALAFEHQWSAAG